MKSTFGFLLAALLGLGMSRCASFAQTSGGARFEGTLRDYNGGGTAHYAVAWVTTEVGTFIKSLRKQGPGWTSSQWDSHCRVWNNARGGSASGSQALDGFSSATASDYSGTNSPIIWTWNCRDAANNLMPDGNYKFWIQYAENSGQGPHTTNGMLWTKGPVGVTNTYPAVATNFTNLRVVWTPSSVAPTITSAPPTPTGTVGVPYNFNCTASGTPPITFSATGLPVGLAISPAGAIAGTPTAASTFNGTITASNGTPPNATQNFSIVISLVPVSFTAARKEANNLVVNGSGPANGIYTVLTATNVAAGTGAWTPIATNSIGGSGNFSFTNALDPNAPRKFYRLRLP